jgi:hypothetical protein
VEHFVSTHFCLNLGGSISLRVVVVVVVGGGGGAVVLFWLHTGILHFFFCVTDILCGSCLLFRE